MSDVLIFGGTTEGRRLAEALAALNMKCDVSAATDYGAKMLEALDPNIVTVWKGRLDEPAMRNLFLKTRCRVVVDATHPYAEEVTETIKRSLLDTDIVYYRVARPSLGPGNYEPYPNVEACVEALKKTEGNILLTTGSKELKAFAQDEELRKRLYVRVLPSVESLNACAAAGIAPERIEAVQGPLSAEYNVGSIAQFKIRHLVGKDSGVEGGEDSKRAAAELMNIRYHLIARPRVDEGSMTVNDVLLAIEKELRINFRRQELDIALVSLGCGSRGSMTAEALRRIKDSDYIFGAARTLEGLDTNAKLIEGYLPQQILPALRDIQANNPLGAKVSVLFTGDAGFYSGCKAVYDALALEGSKPAVYPGVSSIQTLAARFGLPWNDSYIFSCHGIPPQEWDAKMRDAVLHYERTFFICSGPEDVRRVVEFIKTTPRYREEMTVYVGYNLTYPTEETYIVNYDGAHLIDKPGLYAAAVVRKASRPRKTTVSYKDDLFEHEGSPLTKEDVRLISIAALGMKENEVLYDIGAGSGSVALQVATTSPTVKVVAIERNDRAWKNLNANLAKFFVSNVQLVKAFAPDWPDGLPRPDAAFIGGSGGKIRDIILRLYNLNPNCRIVISCVTLETLAHMDELTRDYRVKDLKIKQVAVSHVEEIGKYKKYHMFQGASPICIASFKLDGKRK